MSLFRQWLADNTSPPPIAPDRRRNTNNASGNGHRGGSASSSSSAPPPPPLAGAGAISGPSLGRTYRIIGSPSPTYLGHDECKRFLKLAGELYSRDNLRRFEKRVDELKAMAREVVRPLMGSGLELDIGAAGGVGSMAVGYLTCTRVEDRDLPWSVDD